MGFSSELIRDEISERLTCDAILDEGLQCSRPDPHDDGFPVDRVQHVSRDHGRRPLRSTSGDGKDSNEEIESIGDMVLELVGSSLSNEETVWCV